MIDENEPLDMDWIAKFENIDNSYNIFYLDDVNVIRVKYVYLNKSNEIEKIRQENVILPIPNYLSREEVVRVIKQNCSSTYRLLSILRYNINLDPADIKTFFMKNNYEDTFLKSITSIDAIIWDATISMFQDLNELIFFFYEKDVSQNNKTRRILLQKHLKARKTIRSFH